MLDKNTSHLAGEFLVAGELSRRGYPVSMTFGNAKAVDIYADTQMDTIRIDAKAGRAKGNWPIEEDSIDSKMYYIFVHLQTPKKIEKNVAPEYFIVQGNEILTKQLVKGWGTRHGIKYSTLNTSDYKGRWDKLPLPKCD